MDGVQHDYHVHSSYSDGSDLERMVERAARLGLEGIGFADHCLLSHPEKRRVHDYPMDVADLPDRHADIERLRSEYDIRIFEAVEIDYYPHDEATIRGFVDEHDFDYVIGSVHELSDYRPGDRQPSVHHNDTSHFREMSGEHRSEYVSRYFGKLARLIESGLFDIVAHLDLIERNEALRGLPTRDQYHRIASALEGSSTVPEINGATVVEEWPVLPRREFFEVLRDRDIPLVRGSDAHSPGGLDGRTDRIDRFRAANNVEFRAIV